MDEAFKAIVLSREAIRGAMDFVAEATPDNFDKSMTKFAPEDFVFMSGESLRLGFEEWHYALRASVLRQTSASVRNSEEEKKACFQAFVEFLEHHREAIRERLIAEGKWDDNFSPALLEKHFIKWCWNPTNSLRHNANNAIHEPSPADVAEACRRQAGRTNSPVKEKLVTLQHLYTSGMIKSLRRNI